jgi:hypothetical protein
VLAASPLWAANGNIGLFFDESAALCQQTIPEGTSARLYVYALLQGASGSGLTGAEYKIQIGPNNNADPGWFFTEAFDPIATTIGSGACTPLDNLPRGINVAWPTCQVGDGTKVLIETVDILNAFGGTAELQLKVVVHDTRSNPAFRCPLFTMCNAPVYTVMCLGSNLTPCADGEPPNPTTNTRATCSTSGEAYVNPGPTRNCTVAVAPTSWSAVKGLYNN